MNKIKSLDWTSNWIIVAAVLLGFAALQIWRPLYFLTDDNLCYFYTELLAAARRLGQGQSPFFEPNLFGGFNLLTSSSSFTLYHPWNLLILPFCESRASIYIVDALALANLLLSALSFSAMARCLRLRHFLSLSDRRICFLAISYTFSTFALTVGASWQLFLANAAALPLIGLGLYHPNPKRGVVCIAIATIHGLLGGHPQPFFWTVVLFSLFAIGVRWSEGDFRAVRRWTTGSALGLALLLPVIIPAFINFLQLPRSQTIGFRPEVYSMPIPVTLAAMFLGCGANLLGMTAKVVTLKAVQAVGLPCFLGMGYFWTTFRFKVRPNSLELLCLGIMVIALVMAGRPHWLFLLEQKLPVVRSFRWPFRELLFLVFFIHMWMTIREPGLPRFPVRLLSATGVCVWLTSLIFAGPPTFCSMVVDRRLLLSGGTDDFAENLRRRLPPGTQVFGVVNPQAYRMTPYIPWSLLGGFNYPAIQKVPSISGYVIQGFTQDPLGNSRRHYSGTFSPKESEILLRNPKYAAIVLRSLDPLRLSLKQGHSETPLPAPQLPLTQDDDPGF